MKQMFYTDPNLAFILNIRSLNDNGCRSCRLKELKNRKAGRVGLLLIS